MVSYLIEYLTSQKKLEALALRDLDFEDTSISMDTIDQIQFPLKKLSMYRLIEAFGSEKNLLAFLNKFVDTLEELEIGSNMFPESVYEMIFKKFLKLRSLTVFNCVTFLAHLIFFIIISGQHK